MLILSISFLIFISCASLFYAFFPNLFIYDHVSININEILDPPSLIHFLGTDALGRDILVRLIRGAQTSLSIAFSTAAIALIIGVSLAACAAYIGGKVDFLILRFIDFIYSLPDLLVLSIISLMFSRSSGAIVIGLAFINWMEIARITRSELIRLKEDEFIKASYLIGLSHWGIITRHLIPNAATLILVSLGFTLPRAILSESTLSFIGLGISPPNTSWGTIAGDSFQYIRTNPMLLLFPALLIFLTSLSFNRIADYYSSKGR